MLGFPGDGTGGGSKLWDRRRIYGGGVYTFNVLLFWFFIQDDGASCIMNRFPKEESITVLFHGDSGLGENKTGKAEPLRQRLGHGKKVSWLGTAMSNGSNEIECQRARIKSELTVFGV